MAYTTLIDADTLSQHIDDPKWVVLDCRFKLGDPLAGRSAYDGGHLPSARFADLEQDLSSAIGADTGRHPLPDPTLLVQRFAAWGIDAQTQVVVYDDMAGAMAARCWWLLRWLGHREVALLDGGIQAWQRQGCALETDEPAVTPAFFDLRLAFNQVVDSDAIAARADSNEWLVVDARAAERFRGEVEPIDPVAGHVPGAVNRPFNANLDQQGNFKPASELAQEWRSLLGERSAEKAIMMCGSGVTACHNLLALEHAGLIGARLYAGSWSEWITNPSRPIATGD